MGFVVCCAFAGCGSSSRSSRSPTRSFNGPCSPRSPPTSDYRLEQFQFWATWHWPGFLEVWRESLLHAAESVAGIFDAAATTYPLSVFAAVLLLLNWRGLHGSLIRALRRQFGWAGWLIYLGVLIGALASLVKPLIYWRLPEWIHLVSPARTLQASAVVDTIAFIFEYLCAAYLQVYLITVSLAWIKGLHFGEEALLRFAMRRFSFVLRWLGFVVLASTPSCDCRCSSPISGMSPACSITCRSAAGSWRR